MKGQNFSFTPLGGGREIGANSYYIEWDNAKFLVDAGSHPQKIGWFSMPDIYRIRDLDFVLITHAHQDHIGALPYLYKRFPDVPIFISPETEELAYLVLSDAAKFQYITSTIGGKITFDKKDVRNALRTTRELKQTTRLKGIRVLPFSTNHILGSIGFLLEKNNKKVVFTSDFATEPKPTSYMLEMPDEKIDMIITETTYGRDLEEGKYRPRKEEIEKIISLCNNILQRGGSILFPSFAIERTQAILFFLKIAMDENKLPVVPVYSGGLALPINRLHEKRLHLQFDYDEFSHKFADDIFKTVYKGDGEPAIFVLGAGMLAAGSSSAKVAEQHIKYPDNAVVFTGYCAPNSSGYRLIRNHGRRDFFLNGHPVHCNTDKIYQFHMSCHAPGYDILQIIDKMSPEHIILAHGDEVAIANMQRALATRGYDNIYAPANNETIAFGKHYPHLKPTVKYLRRQMVYAYLQKNYEMMIDHFSAIMEINPWDSKTLEFYVSCIQNVGNKSKVYHRFINLRKHLIKEAFFRGDFEQATAYIEHLRKNDPLGYSADFLTEYSKKIKNIMMRN